MSKKTVLNNDLAREIALALNANIFSRQNSSDPRANAQANLSGKTHYVDGGTLRFFHSRILSTREIDCGLIFAIVESVAADHENRSRGFRFAAFDLCGTVINERISASKETLFRTSQKALDAMWAWAEEFNTLAHYKALLTERAERAKREAKSMADMARTIKI